MNSHLDLERLLRAHLTEWADSRPAEGALEAVLAVTAGIRPRRSWRSTVDDIVARTTARLGLLAGAGRTNRVVWILVLAGLLLALALGLALIGGQKPRVILLRPSPPASLAAIAYHHNGPITLANSLVVIAIDSETGAQSTMIETGGATSVDWSPDGRRLAIVNGARLSVLDTATGSTTAVNPGLTIRSPIAWSPDGKRVAYQRLDGVHVVDVASGKDTHLPTYPGSLQFVTLPQSRPFWTPDGQLIRYSVEDQSYATRVDGSGASLITFPNASSIFALVWSPDGTKVAYLTDPAQAPAPTGGDPFVLQLWVANADGTQPTRVFEHPGCCIGLNPIAPVWSPDGSKLALGLQSQGLQVIDIASGRARNLGTDPSGDLGWRPAP
jgi:Tol biopolymer transport system component